MKLALAILFVGVGVSLIYSGLTGEPLTPALRDVLAGRDPKGKLGSGDSDNAPGIAGKGTTPDVKPPQVLIPPADPRNPGANTVST